MSANGHVLLSIYPVIMENVLFDILDSLPKSKSKNGAFTNFKKPVIVATEELASPPPRKSQKRDQDNALASGRQPSNSRPVRIDVIGEPRPFTKKDHYGLLKQSIPAILSSHSDAKIPYMYEDVYQACQAVVSVQQKGEELYDVVKVEIQKALGTLANQLKEKPVESNMDSEDKSIWWITRLVQLSDDFEARVDLLANLLSYLDQMFVRSNGSLDTIRNLAKAQYFTFIIGHNSEVSDMLLKSVQDFVTSERDMKTPYSVRPPLGKLNNTLQSFGIYDIYLRDYLSFTKLYFEKEAAEVEAQPAVFFDHLCTRLEEETRRMKADVPPSSWGEVQITIEKAFMETRYDWLAKGIIPLFMEKKDLKNLETLYQLFSRLGASKNLCAAFKEYALDSVKKIVTNTTEDDKMIPRLVELRSLGLEVISQCFIDHIASPSSSGLTTRANQEFTYALSDAFTTGFKARRNKPAEMIARHLDRLLRKGQKDLDDAAFRVILGDALALYRFTDDKDVFRTFYHRSLAKRLLTDKTASVDFEQTALKVLKEEYDPEFGSAQDMFKDLALSKDLTSEYHSRHSEDTSMAIMVLQRSSWPFSVEPRIPVLPISMQDQLARFIAFYKTQHASRKLDWNHALGTAVMKARFKTGTKEISVSLYQAIVLNQFNEQTEIPFKALAQETLIEDGELRRTLQSLACGKKRVLTKVPLGKDVNDDDVFVFNDEFTDPLVKFHINSIQAKVSAEESKKTQSAIDDDRKHSLDAAIVRIMKGKRKLGFEDLKVAVIDAVKSHFKPDVSAIKKRIDAMVEQDYIERVEDESNMFSYIA